MVLLQGCLFNRTPDERTICPLKAPDKFRFMDNTAKLAEISLLSRLWELPKLTSTNFFATGLNISIGTDSGPSSEFGCNSLTFFASVDPERCPGLV